MSGEVLLVLLQDREQLLELLVVNSLDIPGRLVEISGQAGRIVGEEGASSCNLRVDLDRVSM